MIDSDRQVKLGELMVEAGFLSSGDVIEAIQVSKRLQMPVGRVLMVSGCIGEDLVQIALQAQILVKEGLVPVESAVEALKIVLNDGKTLSEALAQLNCTPVYEEHDVNLLGLLLLDSNIVSQEQLDLALKTCSQSDIPLASALVLQGALSAGFFPSLFHTQQQIRKGKISRDKAIDDLKVSFLMWLKAEESLKRDILDDEPNQLIDETLEERGIKIHAAQVTAAVTEDAPSGRSEAQETKEESNGEPETAVATDDRGSERPGEDPSVAGLAELAQIYGGSAPPAVEPAESEDKPETENSQQGVSQAQKGAAEDNGHADTPIAKPASAVPPPTQTTEPARLVDILKAAGVLSQKDIQRAYERMLDHPELSASLFQQMGLIDEATAQETLRTHSLLSKRALSLEQAARALRTSRAGILPLEDALGQETAEQRYLNKQWRKETIKRALGGCLIGTIVAGLALGRKLKGK